MTNAVPSSHTDGQSAAGSGIQSRNGTVLLDSGTVELPRVHDHWSIGDVTIVAADKVIIRLDKLRLLSMR